MRRTFLIWLSAVIGSTFIITGILVCAQFSYHAEERAEQMMSTRLNDIMELLLRTEKSLMYLSRANDASVHDRTRALAEIVHLSPEILHNQEDLQGICNRLGAEQIAITDENGIVEAAVPQSYVGLNLADGDDIRPIVAHDGTGAEVIALAGEPESHHLQYAGVRRLDKPGLVRLGFRTRYEQQSRAEGVLNSSAMRLGENGAVIVFLRGVRMTKGGPPISQTSLLTLPLRNVQEVSVDDVNYFAYAVEGGGYRLIGLVPVAEIYRSSLHAVQIVLVSNLLLFLLMFGVVSWLLQRIVLRGISRVNDTLREITEGDLEKKVDVMDNMEFTRLSNGINFMVDSLRSVGEERQQSIKRDLDLARTIQSTALPNKFPAFPHVDEFELYATCLQANEVGGDFYDFAMPDDKHLHFLVADVDASGIPAALFMMRAMSIIRTLTRVGETPVTVVTNANRELCEGNQTGIRMALFYGSLDITTGELSYVNAGHLCVYLQKDDGEYRALEGYADPIIGESVSSEFRSSSLQLDPGDRLFLCTEGVLNAANTTNVPYSEKRLKDVLGGEAATVADVLQLVRSSLRKYMGGSKLKKDITMLGMEYCGVPSNETLITLTAGEPQEAEDTIAQQLEELFAAPVEIAEVQQSVRLVLSALPPEVEVCMELDCTEQQAKVSLSYPAPAFNPLELVSPLAVDQTAYEFAEENRITLWKNLT